jgi:cyclophilin family peptidyl-prolyl cis-trans isomerase
MKSKSTFYALLIAISISVCCATEQNTKEQTATTTPSQTSALTTDSIPFITLENVSEILSEYGNKNPETDILILTDYGNIKIRLYTETPLHRANFIMMVKRGYFNETVFYRVINNFVVQGGNSDAMETSEKQAAIGNYAIPSEIKEHLIHKRGAIAMARNYNDNPNKMSSPFIFYIAQCGPIDESELKALEREREKKLPEEHFTTYLKIGGIPGLDGEHTVFGEVIEGMDVIDAIAKVQTDGSDWPLDDIYMKMEILK